jgi:hypothetical protein
MKLSLTDMKKNCAYCGGPNADTMDHVVPGCLYPASSTAPRLTIPACKACNNGWSDDEAHFRTVLTLAGEEANSVAKELWKGKVLRSLRAADGRRRFEDVWAHMKPVETPTGERHQIFPGSDPRFLRIMRKIVRGLHYHHGFSDPAIHDKLVYADLLKVVMPEEFIENMPQYDFGRDVFEYQFEIFDRFDDIPMSSAWLLTFFENRKFIGVVWKPGQSTTANQQ